MEVPGISSLLRRFRTYEPIDTIEIQNDGRRLVFDRMRDEMDSIYDKIKGKYYNKSDNTVDLIVKRTMRPGRYQVALLDPLAAMMVHLERAPIKPGTQEAEAILKVLASLAGLPESQPGQPGETLPAGTAAAAADGAGQAVVMSGSQPIIASGGPAVIRRGETLFLAQCTAELAGRAVDSQMMRQTFGEQWGIRQKAVFGFVIFIIGALVGAVF